MENVNPEVYVCVDERLPSPSDEVDGIEDIIDAREVFDIIRFINDPEHPLTLEQLNVVQEQHIDVNNVVGHVRVYFSPTIPHCSMATLIGLSVKVRLLRALPERFKIDVLVYPGTHTSENAVNKQLADKERVAAALENSHLYRVVNQCVDIKE